MATTFPPMVWAIDGLVAEGITLLAGPPKAGKSWMALDWCVATAAGGMALGTIKVLPGQALYLALEDTGRRLQNRLSIILHGQPAPAGLTFATQCPPMNHGGLELIDRWAGLQARPRLIVIDVFEKIRGPSLPGESAYSGDYNAVTKVKQLADLHQIPTVLIHHVRKGTSADFINEISGTLGLAGAADTIAVLRRNRGELDGQLLITGRDVDENEYAVKFVPDLGLWQLLGLASEQGLATTRQKILNFVRESEGARPKEIALGTGLDIELVKKTVRRMADDGQLDTDNRGLYFPPPVGVPAVPEPDNPRS